SFIQSEFLVEQSPVKLGAAFWSQLYSLKIEPQHIVDANGLVVIRPYVKPSTFAEGAKNLVVIGRAGVGTDKIDMNACTENDVAVFNAPDSLTHSTASAALVLIVALAKRLPDQERMARSGLWANQARLIGNDLIGQTLGIIGLGRISGELIRLLAPFNMRVLAYSRHCKPEDAARMNVTLVPDIDMLLRESDYVSLHCGLSDRTRGFMGEHEFKLMKKTAYFINTDRGEIVQQDAMIRALSEGWIAGAGLDVFAKEPLPANDPLTKLSNVILTPHWLPTTHRAVQIVAHAMAEGMVCAAQGKVPDNVVNRAVLERPGFKKKLAIFAENAV
ncbi:MAG: NAD(P)-dependent oxidoreductase, partial [Sedimentisphaerales bacterium]|nr:NAD(P)-dependent oxidoreductase [Sedimentisphaerales bacterium]